MCNGSLFLFAAALDLTQAKLCIGDEQPVQIRAGLVTDLHYADKAAAGTRYYRQSIKKLKEAAAQIKKPALDLAVELGDFVDAADTVKDELGYLRTINSVFTELPGKKHYVLGNHCVHTLTKDEFLSEVGQDKSYYSFDVGGFHFVVLDSCFRSDGEPYGRKNFVWTDPNIPPEEIDWLRADLKETQGRCIVFAHQRLDVDNNYGVKNAGAVRKILEESKKVLAVFQGHSHKNDHKEVAGIHYCTLVAMVEGSGEKNNGYSTMDIFKDGTIRITGFRKQSSYEWS